MPEEKFHERMKNDRVRYDLWERDGWLIVTPGAVTDYRFVKQFMKNKAEKHGWTIEEVCADPWCLAQLGSDLIADGLTVIEIIQGYKTLSEPTKNFRESVYSGSLIHSNSPVLTWCVSNAIARIDHNENIILDKSKSKHRIDLAAASINAHVRTMVDANTRSIYETRGMLTL
jgi:phage terminase large subunit-like protein